LLMVLCLASFDELRQTTAPNRTGSAWDVTLDMTGATVFAFLGAATVANAPRKPSVA
jgi:VanZ family protein